MKKYFIFILLCILGVLSGCKSYADNAFYEANNIEKTNYKETLGSIEKDLEINEVFSNSLLDFSYKTASELLEARNGMYSPLSFYIALSELAEITGSDTQKEVLDTLNISDINILREGNHNLFKKISYENNISTLSIANSIWLNKFFNYNDAPLKVLRDKYYASSYGIDFSKSQDKELIGKWVNDNTGGKLGKGDFKDLGPEIIFVLINTIYFYDEWLTKFDKDKNEMDSFYDLDDKIEYMKKEMYGTYFKNLEYESSYLKFKNGMRISFVAPFDSNKFNDLINNPIKLKNSLNNISDEECLVEYSIPKFEYKSSFDLVDYAKSLGINKIFNIADFSPLTDVPLFVSKMYQKTFIEIDEDGGKAAAYTGVEGPKSAPPDDSVLFDLNRPFIYAIYSGNYPIFIGVVTNPSSNQEEVYK